MMNLPDTHTHSSALASGAAPRFICGTSPEDWKQVALLAERDEHVTPFFGIHPWFLNPDEWKEEMPGLESLLKKIPHAGVGETGLDKCRRGIPGLPLQKEALERPASLHCCRAWGTLAEMLKKYPRLNIVLHGWTGALHLSSELPSGNWLLSIGLREMERPGLLASIPLHRLALESDGHPETLPELYRRAARELGMTVNNLVDLVQSNMENLIHP